MSNRIEWTTVKGAKIALDYVGGEYEVTVNGARATLKDDGNFTMPIINGMECVAAWMPGDKLMYLPVPANLSKAVRALKDRRGADRHAAYLASDAGKAAADRARKAREHDLVHNEGGEGYNPHRSPTDLAGTGVDRLEKHYPEGA